MLVLSGAAQSRGSAVGPGSGIAPGTATLGGTITTCSEADLVSGSKTIIVTLTGELTWHADLGADNAQTTAFIQSFDASASPTTGWNNIVRDTLTFAAVTRTSATVATVILPAYSGYAVIASETITPTIPASIVTGQGDALVASPTITVTNVSESVALTGTAMDSIGEADIVTGSKTIIFTVTGDQWVTTLGADNAITTAFLAAITSEQSEVTGWNTVVRDVLAYTMLTRNSASQCTLVLPAAATYVISATETVRATPPATSLLASSSAIVASPIFTVTTAATVADPTQLPTASVLQVPDTSAYDALTVHNQASGYTYDDPVTGVKIWKVGSSTVPEANTTTLHDYSDAGCYVSRGWGTGNNTHTILVRAIGGATTQWWLVDFTRGTGFANWRALVAGARPERDLQWSFSNRVDSPQIAYAVSGGDLVRVDTATNTVSNTGNFPRTITGGSFQSWLHQDKDDVWFTAMPANGTNVIAWNSVTDDFHTQTLALDEPRLERDGAYIWVVIDNTTYRLWRLSDNTLGAEQTDISFWGAHQGSLRGHWGTGNPDDSAPNDTDRYTPNYPTITRTRIIENAAGSLYHSSGNWVQDSNGTDQWCYYTGYGTNEYDAQYLWLRAIGLFTLDGSDKRLLCHHYSEGTDAEWSSAKYTQTPWGMPSPDGKVAVFNSNMRAESARSDLFLVEFPLS